MPDLTDIRLKYGWAYHHGAALHREIETFSRSNPCTVRHEFDAQTKRHEWRIEGDPRQPWPQMSLILGDMLNNFRSALDYLACELGGRAFPIIRNVSDWESRVTA